MNLAKTYRKGRYNYEAPEVACVTLKKLLKWAAKAERAKRGGRPVFFDVQLVLYPDGSGRIEANQIVQPRPTLLLSFVDAEF